MAINRDITADDVIRKLSRASSRSRTERTVRLAGGPSTPGGSGPDLPGDGGMPNPMTQIGAMIRGGIAGAPLELPPGTDGQVLTMSGGVPTWGTGLSGDRYRFPLYTTFGGGDLLFDSDGHLMYVLEPLE